MLSLIICLAAMALPLVLPNRMLLTGLLVLTGLMTALTVWGLLTTTDAGSSASTPTTLAVLGLVVGAVLRLAVFLWSAMVEDRADRRRLGRERELPPRYR